LNANRDRIVCASHGAEFEIETGRCVLGAALGKSLSPAPIEVSAAGEVYLSQ
jgi:nitrite reductase/ring-hydroxylating ferredoxin subunit